jgi:protein-tyrosine phosphatase
VRIPLDVKGQLYASPMPYGPYDRGNTLLKIYKQHRIEFVVVLVTDAELEKKAKRDLLAAYKKNNIQTIRFPIPDFTSPELHAFSKTVDQVTGYLRAGAHIAVHCNAGVGRTGIMAACILLDIEKISADQAIAHVRRHMQTHMTDEQIRLINRFIPLAERISSP